MPESPIVAGDLIGEIHRIYADTRQWAFFRELRLGTGYKTHVDRYIDGYAISCWGDLETLAFEVKVSRSDFLLELRSPSKRRSWMALSNQFYFVTPKGLLKAEEIPADSGLIEVWKPSEAEWTKLPEYERDDRTKKNRLLFSHTKVRAPWRERIRPTWRFLASIARRSK